MITAYVLLRAQGGDTTYPAARLSHVYKGDGWMPALDEAASRFADLPGDQSHLV
jgi:hypothetical protein